MSRASVDPEQLARMMALQAKGWSHLEIAREVGLSRNQVLGRLARVKAPPPSLRATSPASRGEDSKSVGLVAGNSEDRGAYLDALIWKRRRYLTQLREEGGL